MHTNLAVIITNHKYVSDWCMNGAGSICLYCRLYASTWTNPVTQFLIMKFLTYALLLYFIAYLSLHFCVCTLYNQLQIFLWLQDIMKKALREMQTLRVGCSKAEPKIFAPLQTPFPGAHDGQNLISWRWSLPLPTNPVWWGLMHVISSYRGNKPTNTPSNTHTHKQTHRQDRLQYTAPLSLARSVINR